ncbi:MAG: nitroreductase family protein [bacterium]|nr:nitroreductase family protein [bacterium]
MLEIIKKRHSIREYLSKEVEDEKITEILKAAMFSPTAHHSRSWEFIVVKDKDLREKLSQATAWAGFAKTAPVVLVLCSKEDIYWIENASIAAENIYLEATNQGLGTCFIQVNHQMIKVEGKDSEDYIKDLLGIPKSIRVLCLMPIGYPVKLSEEHDDTEFDIKKVHHDKW